MVFLALPLGSSISGLFTGLFLHRFFWKKAIEISTFFPFIKLYADGLGRKRTLLLVNIPYAIGWFILYRSTEVWHIYISLAFLGLVSSQIYTLFFCEKLINNNAIQGFWSVWGGDSHICWRIKVNLSLIYKEMRLMTSIFLKWVEFYYKSG